MTATTLNAGETVAEVVTVGGWYRTTQGRYAEVVWVDGQTQVRRVADRVPTAAEERARVDADGLEVKAEKGGAL